LGIANTWGVQSQTDEQLLDTFHISDAVRADAEAKRCVIFFLRHNTGTTSTTAAQPQLTPRLPGI
jgi:hypothetical protein